MTTTPRAPDPNDPTFLRVELGSRHETILRDELCSRTGGDVDEGAVNKEGLRNELCSRHGVILRDEHCSRHGGEQAEPVPEPHTDLLTDVDARCEDNVG